MRVNKAFPGKSTTPAQSRGFRDAHALPLAQVVAEAGAQAAHDSTRTTDKTRQVLVACEHHLN
jgi:hypothetical protein